MLEDDMSTELDTCYRIFEELEVQRALTIAELGTWPPYRVSFRPEPGSWSATQVLDHIVRAESGTIADVRVGMLNPHILGKEGRPGIAVLDRALRSEQKFKVPPGAEEINPDTKATFLQVAERWEQTRRDLGGLLRLLPPSAVHQGVFHHPFAGWMTFSEMLDHFSAHLYHHGFQLARLRVESVADTRSD